MQAFSQLRQFFQPVRVIVSTIKLWRMGSEPMRTAAEVVAQQQDSGGAQVVGQMNGLVAAVAAERDQAVSAQTRPVVLAMRCAQAVLGSHCPVVSRVVVRHANPLLAAERPRCIAVVFPPAPVAGVQVVGPWRHAPRVVDRYCFEGLPLRRGAVVDGETGAAGDADEGGADFFTGGGSISLVSNGRATPIWIK